MKPTDRKRQAKSREGKVEMGGTIIQPGSRIGSYVFLRAIGSGGMARVLLAKDPNGELVALKVLRKTRFKSGLARFRREFRALSRINHPNVIRVDAYGDLFGHPYIAMEYVDGPDLHTQIRGFRSWDEKLRWSRCEELLVHICRALAAIHRRGLVHRDLKPSNVLISKTGFAKLTDFGIVKDLDPSHDPHMSTTLVGTWAYASPEQITGNPIDHRSDLYSLGVILFAMLTGKRPFVANDMAGYLALHRDRKPPAPRDVNPNIPEHLDEVCCRLLKKAPRDRFQSAQEILYRLEAEERIPDTVKGESWEPPLVARSLELEAINNAIANLTASRGSVVILEGDDGCGKSRLLLEAIDRCRTVGIPFTIIEYQPNAPIFSTILGFGRELLNELGNRVSPRLKADLDAYSDDRPPHGDARYALYDSLRELLEIALRDGPRALFVDDLHMANGREIHLLSFLTRTLISSGELPLLIMGAMRPKASSPADAFAAGEDLSLEPIDISVGSLSRDDLLKVVFDLVGDTLGARLLAQRLHKETEGNPFFICEFLRSLIANGVIAVQTDGYELRIEPDEITTGHLEIPPSVRQMMRSRLASVRPEDRIPLETLAIGGRELDFDVLLDVLDAEEEDVLDSLDRLLKKGIIRERRVGELVFHSVTHRKFADVVYRDLRTERRSDLHRKMAAALEQHYAHNPSALEIVGEHYRRSGDAGRAYHYLVSAAKRLAERSLMQEAWSLTEKAGAIQDTAIEALEPMVFRSLRRDLIQVRAESQYNEGEWEDCYNGYRAVLTMAEEDGDAHSACEARVLLANVLRRLTRIKESQTYAEQALEASRRLHYSKGIADALHCMAALAWSRGNLKECQRLADEGLTVAVGPTMADRRAELLLALTASQATEGHLAAATVGLTEAEGIFRDLRKKRPRCLALANLAELLTLQGEPLPARQRAHAAVQLATALNYKLGIAAATRAMAVSALDLGLPEAHKLLVQSLEVSRKIRIIEEQVACLVGLSQWALERDDGKTAEGYARAGLEAAAVRDPERYAPLLSAHLACSLAESNPDSAREYLDITENALSNLPLPRKTQVLLALAWACVSLQETSRAQGYAREVLQASGSHGFRLLSLESRTLMTHLTTGEEQRTHRLVGQELAKAFTAGLPEDIAEHFMRRPFLTYLDEGADLIEGGATTEIDED